MNKRELKTMPLDELQGNLHGRQVTFVSKLSGNEEEALIRTVMPSNNKEVIHFIGPNGHRWVKIDNIVKISKRKKM